jgi:pyridoxal phosphate-dependent aminotransferase EpsN
MCPEALEKALAHFKALGKLPKAIIVVHLYGQSADMDEIMRISGEYNVPVIEDAAESIGASYKGKHTGTIGKFGIFSFNGNKIITTSGGGALVSNDEKMIIKARFLSTQAKDAAPHYEHTEIGYNYRMSNILAGVGRGQLKVLDDRVNARRRVFKYYQTELSQIDAIEWMPEPSKDYSNRWLSVFVINTQKTKVTSKQLIKFLSESNIEARHLWKPMHQQPVFQNSKYFTKGKQSYCDYLFENGVCLPSSSNMTFEQQSIVVNAIKGFLK